ncbi:MAG TPA: hypothetical protein VLV86_22935 [Vicinamibacterales bacterium]|nr:hypothetical protein [Vicinamibacterales bacterium]
MMRGLFRRLVWTQLIAVLLTAVVAGGAMDWVHAGWDDPACDLIPVQHDHTAHRFVAGPQSAPVQSDHCPLCHLSRVLHTALSAQSLSAHVVLSAGASGLCDPAAAVELFSIRLTSRAPPALVS